MKPGLDVKFGLRSCKAKEKIEKIITDRWEKTKIYTMVNESIDSKDHKPLQPLDELSLTGTNWVFLAHPPLHHLVELIAGYRAHPHQKRVRLGQGEPAAAYKHNNGIRSVVRTQIRHT